MYSIKNQDQDCMWSVCDESVMHNYHKVTSILIDRMAQRKSNNCIADKAEVATIKMERQCYKFNLLTKWVMTRVKVIHIQLQQYQCYYH